MPAELGWKLLAFAAIWFGALHVAAAIGGWRRLAARFPDAELAGTAYRFQSGSMRLANYSFIWTLRVSERGLGISVLFPFRPGHPPLLIPWRALSIEGSKSTVLGAFLKLRVEGPEEIWFLASRRVVEQGAPYMRDAERARLHQV